MQKNLFLPHGKLCTFSRKPEPMRAISEHLLKRLSGMPGIEAISNRLDGGKQIISIAGREVAVGPFASDTEIEVALRLAFSRPKATTMPETENGSGTTEQPAPEAPEPIADPTPLPPRPAIAAQAASPVRRPVAPGSFGASLRAMLDEARSGLDRAQSDGRARVQQAVGKYTEAAEATARISESVAQQIEESADAAMSELSQISNEI